jgi:hypothetical protein
VAVDKATRSDLQTSSVWPAPPYPPRDDNVG